jgi:hypothetical protein
MPSLGQIQRGRLAWPGVEISAGRRPRRMAKGSLHQMDWRTAVWGVASRGRAATSAAILFRRSRSFRGGTDDPSSLGNLDGPAFWLRNTGSTEPPALRRRAADSRFLASASDRTTARGLLSAGAGYGVGAAALTAGASGAALTGLRRYRRQPMGRANAYEPPARRPAKKQKRRNETKPARMKPVRSHVISPSSVKDNRFDAYGVTRIC